MEPHILAKPSLSFWKDRSVLITGGASFIGSHLTDTLISLGAKIKVVDDLSSGKIENIQEHIRTGKVTFHHNDLGANSVAERLTEDIDTIFHLAAAHGGRGYVDLHQSDCAGNFLLDGLLFQAAVKNHVRKIVYASSGCVYPLHIQQDLSQSLFLTEDMVGPPYQADGMYGWAKLMGEMTLQALHREKGINTVSCRYFTVYGPRGIENHAIIAMMARALIGQNPFLIWGDGNQMRNWTYVTDIVKGTILAAEKINDGSAVNLGTSERITVIEAAKTILRLAGQEETTLEFQPCMPTGPKNRVASFHYARERIGWQPRVPFREGVQKTFEWYAKSHRPSELIKDLDYLLVERGHPVQSC